MLRHLLAFLFLTSLISPINFAQGEAWVSNRYAQNCSACHSPSRRNVTMMKRRCTLACQGCHVNPNGGGLRNQYGIWNQQRFLRSFTSKKWFKSYGTPLPLPKQKYAKQPKKLTAKKAMKKYKKYIKNGPRLRTTSSPLYNEKEHDRSDKQEHIVVNSDAEFMYRVAKEDPYRLERSQMVYGGGDFRAFYLSKVMSNDDARFFPMALDFGVRVRPMPEHFSFVFESRSINGPTTTEFDRMFEQTQLRSAYVLVDDLPMATYAMYGVYRPLFGHYTPDHESLHQVITGFDKTARYKAITIGGSPNVPFFNIHIIRPTSLGKASYDSRGGSEEGFAANLGGRWVTLGASLMVSYWSTKRIHENGIGQDTERKMISVNGGIKWRDIILNGDFTTVEEQIVADGSRHKGAVMTIESKYRIWRENYLMANFSNANLSYLNRLQKGASSEIIFGLKSFLLSGTEFEIASVTRSDTDESGASSTKTDTNFIQAQMHMFF